MKHPLRAWRRLLLGRLAEEKIRAEYMKDEMKTPVHLGNGGEAIPVGVWEALPEGTKTLGTYRNHALYLAVTGDTTGFFEEIFGRMGGPGKGKAGSMHLTKPEKGLLATSAVVGTTIPVAVGAAFAEAYKKTGNLVAVFFGDGAAEEGVFWESLNFASLRKLPVLFVCENNELAIHSKRVDRAAFPSVTASARTFGVPAEDGDGTDVADVHDKTAAMLQTMRKTGGPGLLHFPYFRLLEHVGINEDFGAGYRGKPSAKELERLDPIPRFEKALLELGKKQSELDEIRHEVQREIDAAVETVRKSRFPGPEELYTDVYA